VPGGAGIHCVKFHNIRYKTFRDILYTFTTPFKLPNPDPRSWIGIGKDQFPLPTCADNAPTNAAPRQSHLPVDRLKFASDTSAVLRGESSRCGPLPVPPYPPDISTEQDGVGKACCSSATTRWGFSSSRPHAAAGGCTRNESCPTKLVAVLLRAFPSAAGLPPSHHGTSPPSLAFADDLCH